MTAIDTNAGGEFLSLLRPKLHAPNPIKVDYARDGLLTKVGLATLIDRYLLPFEKSPQDLFARVAYYYSSDDAHAQRLYDYISKLWFMPATPVLSNGGTTRGLPISCFLNRVGDSLHGIGGTWTENMWLAAKGGGIGTYWGDVRENGAGIGHVGKSSGIIPFIKVMDSMALAISQGSLRRGSAAVYLPVWHPEIEEFIEIRRPTGGDPNRKSLNLHNGVVIDDTFMLAVANDLEYELRSPSTNEPVHKVRARDLWIRILTARVETGEPYLLFRDTVNDGIPEWHRRDKMYVDQSNLCSEITLFTGVDYNKKQRTAVCCLSSLNLETLREWEGQSSSFIEDVLLFLDNVLEDFIKFAPPEMANAIYSAMMERSVGLGVMGFHSFLQSESIPFESDEAASLNTSIFKTIKEDAVRASRKIGKLRGACPDAARHGFEERFSNMLAIAPTASISIICGGASAGIEPIAANVYTHKTLSGSFVIRNPYLDRLLRIRLGDDKTDAAWKQILADGGSVKNLTMLSDDEKKVYKTAFELDQRWVVRHAAQRAPFICQAASTNLFFPADVHKRDLHEVHLMAWDMGVKSLYYCRTMVTDRAETVGAQVERIDIVATEPPADAGDKYETCEACQ